MVQENNLEENKVCHSPDLDDTIIYRKVHHWLGENEGMMAAHQLNSKPEYTSASMSLSYNFVMGSCFLRTPTPTDDSFNTTLVLKPI